MSDGIEKLQKYAFGMKQRLCDDILVLADQIQREHVSELQAIEAELDKRLMPPGMEWPRFEDGTQITWNDAPEDITAVCLALDGSCYSLHYDMPDDECMCIYDVIRRVKRPVTEVLGADGNPIKVGETVYLISGSEPYRVERLPQRKDGMIAVYGIESKREKLYCYYPNQLTHTQPDTQERIDEDAKLDPCEYVRIVVEIITTRLILLAKIMRAWTVTIADLLRRQRELDARTMGGDAS